jgi:D-psicose/D-tagatose/L-ribulose 3-epimerase
MRLAISNIAWDPTEDEQVASLLQRHEVDAIDVAPAKYFADLRHADDAAIAQVRTWWATRGIELTGMQALLFGTSGLNVFGAAEVRAAMLDFLDVAVCRIGAGLGATRLVFGSPKNRDRSGLSDEEARQIAIDFFARLGAIASARGVTICLEPNPPRYGANFMCNSDETAAIVSAVAHPAIKMQLDTGAITINAENAADVVTRYASLIGHVHASEPDLLPLGDGGTDHCRVSSVLARLLPGHIISIEMLATKNEPHLHAIERALKVAIREYRAPIEAI